MAREIYEKYAPKADTKLLLNEIIDIVEDYASQGLTLTLRQLYYQLVSKDLIKNEERQYKRVGTIVSRARRGGHLDWDALEDRVRQPQKPPEFGSLESLIRAALSSYRLPRFRGQATYIELWVEKDALAGVLWPIADRYHVTLMVNRGYSSTSAMKAAGERIRRGCNVLGVDRAAILYLGDLDPSGEDMVRDVRERLDEYTNYGLRVHKTKGGTIRAETDEERGKRMSPFIEVEVTKLALTMDQVDQYNPPPNPAKTTDSRFEKFSEKHGDESWEVDALPPRVLNEIIEEALEELIDLELMERVQEQEESDKLLLQKAVKSLRSDNSGDGDD
jgi:hypothetical protein